MIKVVLFDVDGVVVTGPMFSDRYIAEFGIALEDMTPFFENEFQECLVGKPDLKTELRKYVKKWRWEKSVDELVGYWLSKDELNSLKKPQAEYFAHIMGSLEDTDKKEVLFWDDSVKFVQGAKDFGIHAELYTNFPAFQQKLSQYLSL